jgi:hypothetical protein
LENDPDSALLDREVLVLDDDGVIVGVAAHKATRTPSGVVNRQDRYLMVATSPPEDRPYLSYTLTLADLA